MPKESARKPFGSRRSTVRAETANGPDGFSETSGDLSNQAVQRRAKAGLLHSSALVKAQGLAGNQAVQRLIAVAAQRQAGEGEPDLGQRIRSAAGRGSSLNGGIQRSLEQAFGSDLSGVRLHADAEADSLSRAVNAVAFTSGSDIFFRSGAYNPGTPSGMHLLAHEAAHTIQQARGPVSGTPAPGGVSISDPGDSFEQAAERAAGQVTSTQRMQADNTDLPSDEIGA